MKIASLDIGLKRIGFAICLTSNIIIPQTAILRKNRNQAANEIDKLLSAWEIEILVVGFPKSKEEMQRRIKHFVNLLTFKGKIKFQNEDMSSVEAEDLIKGSIKYKRDGRIDSLAAKIILERYICNNEHKNIT
ncbi:Putative Holliday junction resolvase YqgF [hydrothermal vent metagenome]|uniref:Holliday junction resolvase YqgF n=1 Tax=hydrothermal vent metagenome TaxID=652676 RepID=A0A3B1E969_9ZZZZ